MKKTLLGLLCLIAAMSCDIPQSVSIKGKPGLYLPLGSPFSRLEEGERLENHVSPANIKKMMSEEENTVVYDYPDYRGDLQVYIVRYPIAEMKRNLTEYVNDVFLDAEFAPPFVIPDDVGSLPSGQTLYLTREGIQQTPGAPLFTIPLADMYRLVQEVTSGPFGIELDYSPSFQQNLRLSIPAFEIDFDTPGTQAGSKLRFVNPAKTVFEPGTDLNANGELEIYVQVSGPCSGTIEPQAVFVWDTAIVEIPDDSDKMSGQYAINNNLGNFLGSDAAYKEVKGYIYAHGLGENALLGELKGRNVDLVPTGTPLKDKPKPLFADPFVGEIPEHSIEQIENVGSLRRDEAGKSYIDMTDLLNNEDASFLEYRISIDRMEIKNVAGQIEGETITVDLVILLPLEFIVQTLSSDPGYVKLDLGEALPESVGEGDLFKRTGSDDDLFSSVDSVTIHVKDPQNTIIGNPLYILLQSPTQTGWPYKTIMDLDLEKKDISETIEYEDLPNPFTPRFEVLLIKDPGEDFATLRLTRPPPDKPPVFDFILAVEAKTDLNINL